MNHVLVTGGAGYIGSHTCKRLAQRGMQPVVLDNLVRGHRQAVRWGPFHHGDIADAELVRHLVQEYGIRSLIHFAAYAYVGESMQRPQDYFDNNVVRGLSLLHAATDAGVRHVVFSSTCAVYGIPAEVPIAETQPTRPVNPYGETKLCVERALHWLGRCRDLRWMALRYFNAAGADPDGEIGEDHQPETHLIPRVMQAALGQIPHLEIFGTDYPTADGTAIRDYIHVADLAEAHVRALEHLQGGGESMPVNLGTGEGSSVLELIAATEKIAGRRVPVLTAPRRAGDPPVLVANPERALRVLGWTPRHSSLEQILQTAWQWQAARAVAESSGRRHGEDS
jgi:UDP-arabinose 4-epimerase